MNGQGTKEAFLEDKARADKVNELLYTVNAEEFRKFSHQKRASPPAAQTLF